MRFLRTNTATRVTVGPFLDKTDGITPKTALTVTACKLTFVCDTAGVPTLILDTNPTASGGANDMIHISGDDAGFYDLELAAADVNYLGRAMLSLTDAANHCPVFHEFMILPAMMYDSIVLGTDRLDTNVTHIADTSQTARDIGASVLVASGQFAVKKNTQLSNFEFVMIDSSDHVSGKTGLSITSTRSIDGGTFSATTNSATEIASGVYKITLSAADLNGDVITLKFSATGADDTLITVLTQA